MAAAKGLQTLVMSRLYSLCLWMTETDPCTQTQTHNRQQLLNQPLCHSANPLLIKEMDSRRNPSHDVNEVK